MGTSKSFGGPGATNPLIPSWLQPPPELAPQELGLPPPAPMAVSPEPGSPPEPVPPSAADPAVEVPIDAPMRFRGPRIRLDKIARAPRTDAGQLRRATSEYVRMGLRGAGRGGARMAVPASTTGRVIDLIRTVEQRGFVQAAKDFGLGDLAGKTPQEIGPVLAEAFLEKGGAIDDGISNRAWVDTVIEAIENGLFDSADIPPDVLIVMLENYVTRTIELRLLQDIGAKLLPIAPDAERAEELKADIRGLIRGEVRRTVRPILKATERIERRRLNSVGRSIYRQAFEYLQALAAEE